MIVRKREKKERKKTILISNPSCRKQNHENTSIPEMQKGRMYPKWLFKLLGLKSRNKDPKGSSEE